MSATPTQADPRVRSARSPSPRTRSVASPPQPALTLYGQPLPPDLLRVAVLLAATPAGVSAPGLAGRCALPESDATRLLHALGAAGLLSASPDPQPRWRLSTGEGVGMPDPG